MRQGTIKNRQQMLLKNIEHSVGTTFFRALYSPRETKSLSCVLKVIQWPGHNTGGSCSTKFWANPGYLIEPPSSGAKILTAGGEWQEITQPIDSPPKVWMPTLSEIWQRSLEKHKEPTLDHTIRPGAAERRSPTQQSQRSEINRSNNDVELDSTGLWSPTHLVVFYFLLLQFYVIRKVSMSSCTVASSPKEAGINVFIQTMDCDFLDVI